MLDLQKAFDTVDHSILLMKLEVIGLNIDVLRWSCSYLVVHQIRAEPYKHIFIQQFVDVSVTLSSSAEIKCGVPQGPILRPLLFLIYVPGVVSNT